MFWHGWHFGFSEGTLDCQTKFWNLRTEIRDFQMGIPGERVFRLLLNDTPQNINIIKHGRRSSDNFFIHY